MLLPFHTCNIVEAGVDEVGRGCLAGPVVAAAVVLPASFHLPLLNDSKQLTASARERLRIKIEKLAISWAVAEIDNTEIDKTNILRASFKAMHLALDALSVKPEHIIVDGNTFVPYKFTPHTCIVKGDAKFASIAAASILAKCHRDALMQQWAVQYPQYGWETNVGYPTLAHRKAVSIFGFSPLHRTTFKIKV